MMKRIAALVCLVLGFSALSAEPLRFHAFVGADFFEYSRKALQTGLGLTFPIEEGLAVEAQAAYAIEPDPSDLFMAVPVRLGMRFSFGQDPLGFHCSVGLEPVFLLEPKAFRLGPYLGLSASYRIHRFLELYAELEQNLLFGGPNYVASGTKVQGGLRFSFVPEAK